jgi:hypothetical protein
MSPAISNTCSDKEQQLAEPLDPTQNRMEAWYMDDDTTSDNRKPHRRTPNEPCPPDVLQQLGVLVRHPYIQYVFSCIYRVHLTCIGSFSSVLRNIG